MTRKASMLARATGIVAAAALLGSLLVAPLVALARAATRIGWAPALRTLTAGPVRAAAGHTVTISATVTVLAVAIGLAFALAIEQRPVRRRGALRLAVAAPLLIPEFVLGFGWSQAYGPAGLTGHLLGVTIPGLLGPAGIITVLTAHAVPIAYLAIAAGLYLRPSPDLERAARASGANGWTALRTVTLPLLRLPLLAAGALVFVTAAGSFAVPEVLGTPAGYATMSTLVYNDLNLSASPGVFRQLTVVALALAVLVLLVIGAADLALGAGRGAPGRPVRVGAAQCGSAFSRWRRSRTVPVVVLGYTILAGVIPMAAVLVAAVMRGPGLAPVPGNWTLANFASAFSGTAGAALARSVVLAAAAAVLIPAMSGLVTGLGGRLSGRIGTLVTLGYALPGSALAVGVLIAYGRQLADSAAIILVAYLAKLWALGHRPVAAGAARLAPQLTAAARLSGARPLTALRTVVLPPMTAALAAAAGLVFVFALHELTMSSILYGPGSETFAVVVLDQQQLGDTGATAALAIVLTLPLLIAGALLLRAARHLSPERAA